MKLKTILAMCPVMVLVFTLSAAGALAAETAPSISAGLGIFNKYVWRGFEYSQDSAVIQPSASIGYKGFGLSFWGNLDTNLDAALDDDQERSEAKWNETDLTLSYDWSVGPVNLGAGLIYYALDGLDDSRELYLSVAYDTLLTPTLTIYREVAHVPAWYISFGLSHSFELSRGITFDLAGSIGYYSSDDDDFADVDDPSRKYRSLHDGMLSAGLTVPWKKNWTVTPSVAYYFPLADKADALITSASLSGQSDFVVAGVTITMAF